MESPRTCLNCGKVLKGRADKKYCDDFCRNAYNNTQNSDQNNFVRNINNILRKNRRILESFLTDGKGMAKTPLTRLLDEGYNPHYHTHLYTNSKGSTYHFCYEYGYVPLQDNKEWVLIVAPKKNRPI